MNAMLRTNRRQRNVVLILVPVLVLLIIVATYPHGAYTQPKWPGAGFRSSNATSNPSESLGLGETNDGLVLASSAFDEFSGKVVEQMRSHLQLTEEAAESASEKNKVELDTCAKRNKKAFNSLTKKMTSLKSDFEKRLKTAGEIGCRTPIAEAVRERVDEMSAKAIKYERLKAVENCQKHIDEERDYCNKLVEGEKSNLKQFFEGQSETSCVFKVGECIDGNGDCLKGLKPLLERYFRNHKDYLHKQKNFHLDKPSYVNHRKKDTPLRELAFKLTDAIDLNLPDTPQLPRQDRDPNKLRPDQILLLSGSTERADESRYVNNTAKILENRQRYCDYWGYHHKFLNFTRFKSEGVEHPVWYKIPAIQEQFKLHPEIEWIWWLDADAFIMNGNYDLIDRLLDPSALEKLIVYKRPVANIESVLNLGALVPSKEDMAKPEDLTFIISHDWLTFNAGSFFIKRSALADMTLESWGTPQFVRDSEGFATFERREQDAFISLYLTHPSIQKHTAVVPQRLINAYTNGGHFHESDIMQWRPGDFVLHLAGLRGSEFDEAFEYNQQLVTPPGAEPKPPKHSESSPPEGDYANQFADLLGPDYDQPQLEPKWKADAEKANPPASSDDTTKEEKDPQKEEAKKEEAKKEEAKKEEAKKEEAEKEGAKKEEAEKEAAKKEEAKDETKTGEAKKEDSKSDDHKNFDENKKEDPNRVGEKKPNESSSSDKLEPEKEAEFSESQPPFAS